MSRMTKHELEHALATLHEQLDAANHDFECVATKLAGVTAENVQLRKLNADWAHQSKIDSETISRLKAQTRTVDAFATRCAEYCAANNVRSVPAHIAREFRA